MQKLEKHRQVRLMPVCAQAQSLQELLYQIECLVYDYTYTQSKKDYDKVAEKDQLKLDLTC